MNERFTDLKKVPKEPAMRLLAMANADLDTKLNTPTNASVEVVLDELEKAGAFVDMMRLLSVSLPARERTWWACLAARDVVGEDVEKLPPPLIAAEQWVRKPSDETRDAARLAAETAAVNDDTTLCAVSVVFYDETLGTGELAEFASPAGASQTAVFGMNVMALDKIEGGIEVAANVIIDRALDIARGGNGQLNKTLNEEPKEGV
jgi:hypothetical protein